MSTLPVQILNCKRCRTGEVGGFVYYSPVYSFGDPEGKKVIVVAHNPSTREFEDGYLLNEGTIENRLSRQLTYFDRRYYEPFFKKIETLFEGENQRLLGWNRNCWEKVGFLDLTKCSTRTEKGQWSTLKPRYRSEIVGNCEGYLVSQLELYKPRAILAYGASVCEWFGNKYRVNYSNPSASAIKTGYSDSVKLVFLYQRQGRQPHSPGEVSFVRSELAKTLK
jgi:uracil-DNA glycosylase